MDTAIQIFSFLFGGIGLVAIPVTIKFYKNLKELGWEFGKKDFYAPSSLSYFKYGVLKENEIPLIARRILAIRALESKTITVQYPVNTSGKIERSASLSHPDRMKLIENENRTGVSAVSILAEKGRQYIVSSESSRKSFYNKKNVNPNPSDPVMTTLYEQYLKSEKHDYVGSRMPTKVAYHRIVLDFDVAFTPEVLHLVHIDKDGKVLKDDDDQGFIKAISGDGKNIVLDVKDPLPGSGIYIWWIWP